MELFVVSMEFSEIRDHTHARFLIKVVLVSLFSRINDLWGNYVPCWSHMMYIKFLYCLFRLYILNITRINKINISISLWTHRFRITKLHYHKFITHHDSWPLQFPLFLPNITSLIITHERYIKFVASMHMSMSVWLDSI